MKEKQTLDQYHSHNPQRQRVVVHIFTHIYIMKLGPVIDQLEANHFRPLQATSQVYLANLLNGHQMQAQ